MKLKRRFNSFLKELIAKSGQDIVTIIEFGSKKAFEYPKISDWDLLIITKTKAQIKPVIKVAKRCEFKHLNYTDSKIINFLEEHFFVKPSFAGVHLVVFSLEDLTDRLEAKSWKLKILGIVFGQRFFLHDLKDFGKVRFGQDLIVSLSKPRLSWIDLLIARIKLCIVLLAAPFISVTKFNFKIRCFKVIIYYKRVLEIFFKLSPSTLEKENPFFKVADFYRYHPDDYPDGLLKLYFTSWALLFKRN